MRIILMMKICLSIFTIFFISSLFADTASDTDNEITAIIKHKIATDSTLLHQSISVVTQNKIVTLSGTVDSLIQANTAVSLAQSTPDVTDVKTDNFKIKDSTQFFSDSLITAKIKGLFFREEIYGDKDINAISIHVETNNGVVYLTGVAKNQKQVENAVEIAKSVNGVVKVEANIKISKNQNVSIYHQLFPHFAGIANLFNRFKKGGVQS